jgi:type 1 glutamine amidotransferase
MRRVVEQYCPVIACIGLVLLLLGSQGCTTKEVNVLLTHGGHDFEKDAFFKMFIAMPGIRFHAIELPDSADILKPGLERKYDVIVMYDMVDSITSHQRNAFCRLLKTGIGVVALHHNLAAHRNWDEFTHIIGGKYLFEPQVIKGEEYKPSTYFHDQDITVRVASKDHPVTKGISDFQIHDETYKGYYTAPDVDVLLTTEHVNSDPELAWTTAYENSPVVYLLLGHDSKAWRHPVYPELLLNAIRWAAGN